MSQRVVLIGVVMLILTSVTVVWNWLPQPSAPDETPRYVTDGVHSTGTATTATISRITVVAENLEIPWDVAFLPDGELLVTERPGTVLLLKQGVEIPVEGVRHIGEGGLMGVALHPDFSSNQFVYLYHTTETDDGLRNRIVRYTLRDTTLTFDRVIIDDIPGARYHDGGRIAFGPDGYLYATIGDATNADLAQDPTTLHGTVIRLTPEGEIPADNPFDSPVYSYGHRNPQGLTWDAAGRLWSTEHGRSVLGSGFDELNLLEPGANYGWPESEGDTVESGTVAPARHSTAEVTWAPASVAYHQGSIFFAGLRGETLYQAVLEGETVVDWREHLVGEYGRLRTVTVGPDGFLYVTTSNRDGRGDTPAPTDDRILRIDPAQLSSGE